MSSRGRASTGVRGQKGGAGAGSARAGEPPGSAWAAVLDGARRAVGLILVALVAVPAFRLVDDPGAVGPTIGRLMAASGADHWRVTWIGLAAALGAGALLALASRGRLTAAAAWLGRGLVRPSPVAFAVAVAILGAALAAWVTFAILDARTVLNDASVQLIQGRYFAAGRLSGPPLDLAEHWAIQFMVLTEAGWVSQYPPGHALALAAGLLLGAPWLVGVGSVAVAAGFTSLSAERLLPDNRAVARLGAVFVAASPLLLGLAAGYMNHATAAALGALALYLALRAEDGAWGWAVASGAAVGLLVLTRPLTGLVIGTTVTVGTWVTRHDVREDLGRLGSRVAALFAGGLPFAIGFALYNARFFGSPLTLGYTAASGPSHGLGFHLDPWGRPYGPTEAIGFTSAELLALGRELLGTPLPLVALVGAYLLVARRLARGERIFLAWAGLTVLANAFYWHHDLVFGPRMLGESVPAWCMLAALAAVGLARALRGDADRTAGAARPAKRADAAARRDAGSARRWASEALVWALVIVLGYAAGYGGAQRVARLGSRLGPVPAAEPEGPALGFVHEAWSERLGGRLAARGMRLDSIRTVLTRYSPCALQAALDGTEPAERVDACRREQASDARAGIGLQGVGLTGLMWTGDLPGIEGAGTMWVRDLGPRLNRRLLERYPDREPLVLLPPEFAATGTATPPAAGGATGASATRRREWVLVPYEVGMAALWPDTLPP